MMTERDKALPYNLPPLGLSRTEAAAYIGVSPSLFDTMVKDERTPKPKKVNSRTIWDIRQVDKFFDELLTDVEPSSWEFGT